MSFGACSTHQRRPREKGEVCKTCNRIAIEGKIARKTAKALLDAGYEISVYDGEEVTLKRSRTISKIMEALFTTDDDHLFVYEPGSKERFGGVWFVYGNSGWDLITDYTTNLEKIMEPVLEYANQFDV